MRVRLKGINRVSKKLADGSRTTYFYAWKGGPRIPGKPGSQEFVDAYNSAISEKIRQPSDTLQAILSAYQDSPRFLDLAPRTRKDYVRQIRQIETEFSSFPLAALTDRRTRGEFLAWRDNLAVKSRRQADYTFATFAAILAWATDRGLVASNPCARPGKLYRSKRTEAIWTAEDETALQAVAPRRIWLAFMLAIWTGQRQGDLLRLTWKAYDGNHIRLRQSNGGRRVVIPVSASLKTELDNAALAKKAVTILTTTKDTPWTSDGFRTSWGKAVRRAKVTGLTFHDLRGTAVTRLALADCSEAEIATITGHSLKDVGAILDAHYLSRDSRLAESAMKKRELYEGRTKTPN